MTTEQFSITTLRELARILQVSVDAPMEEIKRAYERHRNELIMNRSDRALSIIDFVWNSIKKRTRCKECRRFGISSYMRMLVVSNEYFCGDECLNIYQSRTSAIQQITNQFQQKGINKVSDLGDALVELQALFPWNCQCEHPWTYEHHIQNCLTTKEQVENFKNEVLKIVEQVTQNRLTQQPNLSTSSSTPPTAHADSENNSYSTTSNSASSSTFSNQDSTNYSSSSTPNSNSSSSSTIPNDNDKNFSSQTTSPKEKTDNSLSSPNKKNEGETPNNFGSSASQESDILPSTPTTSPAENKDEKSSPTPNQQKPEHPVSSKENSPKQVSEENQAVSIQAQVATQEIKNELKNLAPINWKTLANGQYQSWEQEINQLTTIEQIIAYQKALLQAIEEQVSQSQLKQNTRASSTSQEKGKGMVPWILLGSILVMSGLVGYLVWLKRKRKSKIVNIKRSKQ